MANFFTDRIVEHPGRVRLTEVETDVYDVTPEEGTITEEGTALNAQSLEDGIQAMIDASLNDITFTAGGSVHVPNIQQGRETIKPTANTVTSKDVTFPQEMETVPRVSLTVETAAPQNVSVGVSNISTTGFRINIYRVNTTTTAIQWLAQC